MKSNSFGETVRRIEAERKSEAEAAIAAGWTEADHPHKCCPKEPAVPRTIKTASERRAWCLTRAVNAERQVSQLRKTVDRLEAQLTPDRRADFGETNIPIHKRAASIDSAVTKAAQLVKARTAIQNHQTRANHWRKKAEATK